MRRSSSDLTRFKRHGVSGLQSTSTGGTSGSPVLYGSSMQPPSRHRHRHRPTSFEPSSTSNWTPIGASGDLSSDLVTAALSMPLISGSRRQGNGWAAGRPGTRRRACRDEVAYLVPAGSRIVAELHHGSGGERVHDTGEIALYYAIGSPANCPSELVLRAEGSVPPHAANEKFQASTTLPADTMLLALIPQLHEGARWLEVRARKPNGAVEVPLLVRNILHDWPTPYILDSPLPLPQGTELSVITYYENPTDESRPGGVRMRVSAYNGVGCAPARVDTN